jgi:hypothetical protein
MRSRTFRTGYAKCSEIAYLGLYLPAFIFDTMSLCQCLHIYVHGRAPEFAVTNASPHGYRVRNNLLTVHEDLSSVENTRKVWTTTNKIRFEYHLPSQFH